MSENDPLLEQIVSGVLARLATRTETVRANPVEPAERSENRQQSEARQVVLSEPVITEAVLKERLAGARNLTIASKAIVTPSAIDYLKKQGITWSREANEDKREVSSAHWLAIAAQATPAVRRLVQEIERSNGNRSESKQSGSDEDAVAAAVEALCRDNALQVVVFADAAERVACLANRHECVRATVLNDRLQINCLKTSFAPNVWIINTVGRADGELKNLWVQLNSCGA